MSVRWPVCILGTGSYAPDTVLDNQHFVDRLDTSHEWILTRTGIRERRKASASESTSTMATRAAERALTNSGLTANDIDMIVCGTATPDFFFPSTASIVQGQLGTRPIPAFDVSAACAGFIYATSVGAAMIVANAARQVLVLGAETLTRFSDPDDRATCILFGDAGGAAVLGRSTDPDRGVLHCDLGCDGTRTDYIVLPGGGSRMPASETVLAERYQYMRMKGREVYKFAVGKMEESIDRALLENNLKPSDLKLLIPHQSNLRIIESVQSRLGLPKEKIAVNIDRYGNTSAASIILALDEARRDGTLKQGDLVLMIAVGAGITWGTMIIRL